MSAGVKRNAEHACKHLNEEVIASGKWLSLNKITYLDSKGSERTWETTSRTTTASSNVDSVGIIPILRRTLHVDCIVMVKQYRPPVKKYSLEFPAGLVDEGESLEDTAIRELKEETGYTAVCKHISPATTLDAGLEDCTLALVTVEIDGDSPENLHPKQKLEETEDIETIVVPQHEMLERLNAYSKDGIIVDSRVYSYAIALTQASKPKTLEQLNK